MLGQVVRDFKDTAYPIIRTRCLVPRMLVCVCLLWPGVKRNHLSSTTCLTHALFKHDHVMYNAQFAVLDK